MKFKLFKITQEGVKELVLVESAVSIYFDTQMLAARFYPRKSAHVCECIKIIVIPAGYMAEIVEDEE